MKNQLKIEEKAIKYWWISLVSGLLALVLGVWCFVTPDLTMVALSYLFVTVFFVGGILEIVLAVSNRKTMTGWGWTLGGGVLEIILSILIFTLPVHEMTSMFIFIIGTWILFRSIWMLGGAIDAKQTGIKGWGWLLAAAILGILFSATFLLIRTVGGLFMVAFLSVALLIYGFFRTYMAFYLKSLHTK